MINYYFAGYHGTDLVPCALCQFEPVLVASCISKLNFLPLQMQAAVAENVCVDDLRPKCRDRNGMDIIELQKNPAIKIINTSPWAILLPDNNIVYLKEAGRDHFKGEEICKYSIGENTWAPLARPANLRGFMNYTLATYQSQLAYIGGLVLSTDGGRYMRTTTISLSGIWYGTEAG